MAQNKAKPDDRKDNVKKLQEMVVDTIENMEEAEATMAFSSDEEQENIKEKNKRRRESIEAMRNEIKDEYRAKESNYRDDHLY